MLFFLPLKYLFFFSYFPTFFQSTLCFSTRSLVSKRFPNQIAPFAFIRFFHFQSKHFQGFCHVFLLPSLFCLFLYFVFAYFHICSQLFIRTFKNFLKITKFQSFFRIDLFSLPFSFYLELSQ